MLIYKYTNLGYPDLGYKIFLCQTYMHLVTNFFSNN